MSRLDPNFNNDNICARPKVDAIFLTADRSTYVFQGDNYWKLTKDSVAPGYPRKIYQDWRGVPSNIDAAFTWESTRYRLIIVFHTPYYDYWIFIYRATYFIKGSKYWKFENMKAYPGYPKVKIFILSQIKKDVDLNIAPRENLDLVSTTFVISGHQRWLSRDTEQC